MGFRYDWNSFNLAKMRLEKSYFECSSLDIRSIFSSMVARCVLRLESMAVILSFSSAPMLLY